jgi:mannose-6-phosphate isomerase-like protein (cupin superfamily)
VTDVRPLAGAEPFTTKDGSTIRELCGIPVGGTEKLSLAEAMLSPGQATERHYHAVSEEVYFVLEGVGEMEIDGAHAPVGVDDAVPIPAGSRHQIRNTGTARLRFLCACAPPYAHDDTFFD